MSERVTSFFLERLFAKSRAELSRSFNSCRRPPPRRLSLDIKDIKSWSNRHDVKVGDTLPTGSVLILDIDASAELAPIGLNNKDSDQKTK